MGAHHRHATPPPTEEPDMPVTITVIELAILVAVLVAGVALVTAALVA